MCPTIYYIYMYIYLTDHFKIVIILKIGPFSLQEQLELIENERSKVQQECEGLRYQVCLYIPIYTHIYLYTHRAMDDTNNYFIKMITRV